MISREMIMIKLINSKILKVILVALSLTSCSTYPNKFKCGDARGLGCTMLHEVDKQIDSGQIVEAYLDKKCRGKNCPVPSADSMNLKKQEKANIYKDQIDELLDDDNNLNF